VRASVRYRLCQQPAVVVDVLRTRAAAITTTDSWTVHRWRWQFSDSQRLNQACVPFFDTFGAT
jgi:hypothetical protein